MTQFGRALAELNIEILCANSSQDKGRVKRANLTLQDRLVKEPRLAEVSDMDVGNLFLPAFMERFNERFSVPPAKTEDLHRRLSMSGSRLRICSSVGSSATLAQTQQDLTHRPKVTTNSKKSGYKKSPRRVHGPDFKSKTPADAVVEMTV